MVKFGFEAQIGIESRIWSYIFSIPVPQNTLLSTLSLCFHLKFQTWGRGMENFFTPQQTRPLPLKMHVYFSARKRKRDCATLLYENKVWGTNFAKSKFPTSSENLQQLLRKVGSFYSKHFPLPLTFWALYDQKRSIPGIFMYSLFFFF